MADPPPRRVLPPVPLEHPADIHPALRNTNIVLLDGENERSGQAYVFEDSPNVERAYILWGQKRRRESHQGRYIGTEKIMIARKILRERLHQDNPKVFRQTDNDESVAIKRLHKRFFEVHLAAGNVEDPWNEIAIMQQFGDDQHMITCIDALEDADYLYIVMPHVQQGELSEYIQWGTGGGVHPDLQMDVPTVARRLVENLQHLRRQKLVHRDLKPENVVVRPPVLPLIDFAQTLQIPFDGIPFLDDRTHLIAPTGGRPGTDGYCSPEILKGTPFDHKSDVWAFGSILFNILTGMRICPPSPIRGQPPNRSFLILILLRGLENEELLDAMMVNLIQGAQPDELCRGIQAVQAIACPHARSLLLQCLRCNPDDRPEPAEMLNHPFFQQAAQQEQQP